MKIPVLPLLVSAAVLTGFSSASASTWSGAGSDANWSTVANWDTVPTGSVALVFGGSTGLSNTNDLSGLAATGITFNSGSGAFVLGGGALGLSGTIVNNSTTLQTINEDLALTAASTVNTASGNITLGGAVTGAFILNKTGAGTLALSGTGGASRLSIGNGAAGGSALLSGGSWTQSGTLAGLGLIVGNGTGGSGSLTVSGGTHTFGGDNFNNSVLIGTAAATGTLSITGGTVNVDNGNASAASGASILLGSNYFGGTNSNGILSVSGGLLNVAGGRILMAANDASSVATLNLSGTGAITLGMNSADSNRGVLRIGVGTATVNLDGGTLTLSQILTSDAITGTGSNVYLNGVTIRAAAATTDWISGATVASGAGVNVQMKNGGATFDTNGFDVTIADTIRQVAGQTGALIKTGAGTLTLAAGQGFTGGVTVNQGTLKFGGNDTFGAASSTPAGAITANAGTTLTNAGTFTTITTLNLNGATLTTAGGASSAYQAFKLRGNVNVTGTSVINSNTSSNANNAIHLGGDTAGTRTTFNIVGSSDTLTISAVLRDGVTGQSGAVVSAGLIKSGAGTLTLNAANSFTSGAAINAGTLVTGNASALGTGAITLGGGTLSVGATGLSNLASLAINTGKLDTSAGAVSLTGAFSLAGGVWKLGASADGVASGGAFTLTAGVIDLGGLNGSVLNGTTAYSLIFGTGTSALTNANFINGNAAFAYAVDANGDLLVTAVPEPATYGLLASGTLAVAGLARRRKSKAV